MLLVYKLVLFPEHTMIISFFRIILNRCMISFMNPKVDFEDLNRFQRISCIKVNFYKNLKGKGNLKIRTILCY